MSSRKKATYGKHVSLTEGLLTDPIWQNLSRSATMVWIYLRREYIGGYDTRIRFSSSKINGLMSRRMFWYGIKELKSVGWLEVAQEDYIPSQGTLYKLKGPHAYFIFKGRKLW